MKTRYESIALCLPILAGAYLIWLRISVAGFPGGDEGSWMGVAAQLSRGQGFTSHWMEYHWMSPYALPRPDEFRYPGLTFILAVAFRLLGISYSIALATVGFLFIALIGAVFFVLRKPLGFWPAYGASCFTAFSLLQLQWNSGVYTEGLFGVVLAGWVWGAFAGREKRVSRRWWMCMGAGVGLLYLVRPNGGILCLGLLAQFLVDRKRLTLKWDRLFIAAIVCILVTSPWLIRSTLLFGNPFHIAGSAGLLRDTSTQSLNLSALEYFSMHSIFFPVMRLLQGCWRFLIDLHFFEHGLEVLPLLGLGLSWFSLKPMKNFPIPPSIVAGFIASFLACAYAAYGSWAGVRYFTAFLPFVYGFGIYFWLQVFEFFHIPRVYAAIVLIGICLFTTYYPHRFYARKFAAQENTALLISEHIRTLEQLTPNHGFYYAKNLCQVNFMSNRHCVGLQELFDSTWFERSEAQFHPRLIALKFGEDSTLEIRQALRLYRKAHFQIDTIGMADSVFYLGLRHSTSPP